MTNEGSQDVLVYLAGEIYRGDRIPNVNPLTDRWEPPFLHTADPNPNDCDRKDPCDSEKQNPWERFLLGLTLFWFPPSVRVIRRALTGTRPGSGGIKQATRICIRSRPRLFFWFRIVRVAVRAGGFPPPTAPVLTIRRLRDPVSSPCIYFPLMLPTTLSAYRSISRPGAKGIGYTNVIMSFELKCLYCTLTGTLGPTHNA